MPKKTNELTIFAECDLQINRLIETKKQPLVWKIKSINDAEKTSGSSEKNKYIKYAVIGAVVLVGVFILSKVIGNKNK